MKLTKKQAKLVLKQLANQGKRYTDQKDDELYLTKVFEFFCGQLREQYEINEYGELEKTIKEKEKKDPKFFYPPSTLKIIKSFYPLSPDSVQGIAALKNLYDDCIGKGDYDAAEALFVFFVDFKIKVDEEWCVKQEQRIENLKIIQKKLPTLDPYLLEKLKFEKNYEKIKKKYSEFTGDKEYEESKAFLCYARNLIDPHTDDTEAIQFLEWVELKWMSREKEEVENKIKYLSISWKDKDENKQHKQKKSIKFLQDIFDNQSLGSKYNYEELKRKLPATRRGVVENFIAKDEELAYIYHNAKGKEKERLYKWAYDVLFLDENVDGELLKNISSMDNSKSGSTFLFQRFLMEGKEAIKSKKIVEVLFCGRYMQDIIDNEKEDLIKNEMIKLSDEYSVLYNMNSKFSLYEIWEAKKISRHSSDNSVFLTQFFKTIVEKDDTKNFSIADSVFKFIEKYSKLDKKEIEKVGNTLNIQKDKVVENLCSAWNNFKNDEKSIQEIKEKAKKVSLDVNFSIFKEIYYEILLKDEKSAKTLLEFAEKDIFSEKYKQWMERQKSRITLVEGKDKSEEFIAKFFLAKQFESIKNKNLQNAKLCSMYLSIFLEKYGFIFLKDYFEDNISLAKKTFGENIYDKEKAYHDTVEAVNLLSEMWVYLKQNDRTTVDYQIKSLEAFIENDSLLKDKGLLTLKNQAEKAWNKKKEEVYIEQVNACLSCYQINPKNFSVIESVAKILAEVLKRKELKDTTWAENTLKDLVLLCVNAALDEEKYVDALNFLHNILQDYSSSELQEKWKQIFFLLVESYEKEEQYTKVLSLLEDVLKNKSLGEDISYEQFEKRQQKIKKKIENKILVESERIRLLNSGVIELADIDSDKKAVVNNI